MLVYLAAPVDSDTERNSAGWVAEATAALHTAGAGSVFRPGLGWAVGGEPEGRIQAGNMAVLETADAMLAYLPVGVSSIGVPIELYVASQRGVPVVVVSDQPRVSVVLRWLGVSVVVADVEKAAELLVAMVQEDTILGVTRGEDPL